MATQLEKLMFSIDLMDRVTGPAGKIEKALNNMGDQTRHNFSKITDGFDVMQGAGNVIQGITAPAQELNMAIGSVRSLDVAQASLDALADTAIGFSIRYGESASDFTSSSYDIQSAITGLVGNELASFTNASGILAKGTKSDANTITDYMGTMYGIFKKTADGMGKAQWVEQLTGQTATAVQMFKTTGGEMAASFSSLGADATSAGIAQAEQMAVLGKLQATMSGSEAGTKYQAFLRGVGEAQNKLGLNFTDSNGRMLGMVDILGKLQGKFGDTLDVAEGDSLKKAFGSDEAVGLIKLLMADTEGLAGNIDALGQVKGMEKAMKMADDMVDPFQQWDQGISAVRIGLGQALLPVLQPFLTDMAEGAGTIYQWTQEFPGLTKWVGYGALTIAGITGVVATFGVMMGLAGLAASGFSSSMLFMKFATGGVGKVLGLARAGFLWLNTAMWANPAVWVVGGILALTAGVAAAIYYWDDLKAAFLDSSWGQAIMGWIDKILAGFQSLTGPLDWVKDKMAWLPGMGPDPGGDIPKTSPSLDAPRRSTVMSGGVGKTIANAVTNNSRSDSSTMHVGQIVTNRPVNAQEVSSMLTMGG